ncbi:MAG: hypothetical protein EXS55_04565 [Candidatus Magasanikbacteria bacterium]|nr:hypothetical protein [Candidatus Magasanikbacteria bacterium]
MSNKMKNGELAIAPSRGPCLPDRQAHGGVRPLRGNSIVIPSVDEVSRSLVGESLSRLSINNIMPQHKKVKSKTVSKNSKLSKKNEKLIAEIWKAREQFPKGWKVLRSLKDLR